MNPRDRGETDAIVRRLVMYAKVYADPPVQERSIADTRAHMGRLIREGFLDLDSRLRAGEPLPEVWDVVTYYQPRAKSGQPPGEWRFVHPPGLSQLDQCTQLNRTCDWIDLRADETACRRCHTIRMRVPHARQEQEQGTE